MTTRPLSLGDIAAVKQAALDRGKYYPSAIQAFSECPYRYAYDKREKREQTEAQRKGSAIHAAVNTALGLEDGVCCQLDISTANVKPYREELTNGMVKLHKAVFYVTAEADISAEWKGLTIGAKIDQLVECQLGPHTTYEVIDIKTMGQIRSDKVSKYLESIQFTWYAYVSDAWQVSCWPIEAREEYETDGNAAGASALAYVRKYPELCKKVFPDRHQAFLEKCDVPLQRYVEWLTGNLPTKRQPNMFCKWCNAFIDGVCKGR